MKIQDQNTRMYSQEQVENQTQNMKRSSGKKENKKTFFIGNWNQPFNEITEKKLMAQKKALKVVGDAFSNQVKVDQDLADRKGKIDSLLSDTKEAYGELADLDKQKAEWMESYGVEPDSQEEQDLQTLLTGDDCEKKFEICKDGLSEYQTRVLDMQKSIGVLNKRIQENKKQVYEENDIIRKVGIERLKDQSMIDAEQQEDDIMKAASDEAKGLLLEDAMDHVDEKQEETEEASKEKAEEEKEIEERKEALEEKIAEMEALAEGGSKKAEKKNEEPNISTEHMMDLDSINKDVKQEVQNIVDQMKLVIEDIKGSQIDIEF